MSALISPLAIAPMIDWTYSHFRMLMRMLAPHALLYTEMITTGAILNKAPKVLDFHPLEHPLALQLGGSEPRALAESAAIAEALGYVEINLNLGCPSPRVQSGQFGACLMKDPGLVVECIAAMKSAVRIPVTAKTRIGIDDEDSYPFFKDFASRLVEAGIDKLIVHARKAWLHGLNPKQNRTIPPLHYHYVHQIKKEFARLPVVINGHIENIDDIFSHLEEVDGVMLGRLACQNPYKIAEIHHVLYPETPLPSRSKVLGEYIHYAHHAEELGAPLSLLLKPIFNMAYALPGAGAWKNRLMNIQQQRLKLSTLLENIAIFPNI